MALSEEVEALYHGVLDAWNRRSAYEFSAFFADHGSTIGFDGSEANGRDEIAAHLAPIFEHHPTPAYIAIVREVRFPHVDTAILRAVVGMVPAGSSDIDPTVNAVQTMVASRHGGTWQIELLQSTPAVLHGRPEASQALSDELRTALRSR